MLSNENNKESIVKDLVQFRIQKKDCTMQGCVMENYPMSFGQF